MTQCVWSAREGPSVRECVLSVRAERFAPERFAHHLYRRAHPPGRPSSPFCPSSLTPAKCASSFFTHHPPRSPPSPTPPTRTRTHPAEHRPLFPLRQPGALHALRLHDAAVDALRRRRHRHPRALHLPPRRHAHREVLPPRAYGGGPGEPFPTTVRPYILRPRTTTTRRRHPPFTLSPPRRRSAACGR